MHLDEHASARSDPRTTRPTTEERPPTFALELLLRERQAAAARAGEQRRRRRRLRPVLGPARRAGQALSGLWARGRLGAIDGAGRLLGTERVVRALPDFRGVFELDLRSDVTRNLLLGRFERALVPVLEAAVRRGDFIDVGANAGLYTVLAARLLGDRGRVLAVEPAPSVLAMLRANLLRNGLSEVIVFPGVAAAEPGQATLHVMEGNEEYASLGGLSHPLAPRRDLRAVEVPAETLDRLAAQHNLRPAFLKIDTEGAEGLVLSGAGRLLAEARPVILSELDDRLLPALGWDGGRVRRLLWQAGYRIYDAYSGAEHTPDHAPSPYIGEIVALPR